jgi:hypothetical protein
MYSPPFCYRFSQRTTKIITPAKTVRKMVRARKPATHMEMAPWYTVSRISKTLADTELDPIAELDGQE